MQQLVIQGDSAVTSGTIEDNSEFVLVSMLDGMMGQVPQRFSFRVELFFRNLSSVTLLDVVVNGCLVRCDGTQALSGISSSTGTTAVQLQRDYSGEREVYVSMEGPLDNDLQLSERNPP